MNQRSPKGLWPCDGELSRLNRTTFPVHLEQKRSASTSRCSPVRSARGSKTVYSVAFRAGADHEDPVEVRELDKSRIGLAELAYRLPIELRRAGAKARIMSHAEQEIGRDASLVDGIGVPQPIRRQIDTVMGSDP